MRRNGFGPSHSHTGHLANADAHSAARNETLRGWARGHLPSEAGVELLIRQGALLPDSRGCETCGAEQLIRASLTDRGFLSGSQRRVADVAEALLAGTPLDLREALPGLDRRDLHLVLAALAHTAGGHQYSTITIDTDGARVDPLPPDVPWPPLCGGPEL